MKILPTKECECCKGSGFTTDWKEAGEIFKQIRKDKGLTLAVLCKRMGISIGYLSDLEHGRKRWPEGMVERYLKGLGK